MLDQTFTLTGSEFHLHLREGGGDVAVRGTDDATVRVQGADDADKYHAEWNAEQNALTLDVTDDLTVYVPRDVTARVRGEVNDLNVAELKCRLLYVERVRGDAVIESVQGDLELGGVASDLHTRDMNGNLQVGSVGSNALIKNITGNLTLRGVGGDLTVQGAQGNVSVAGVGGDARLVDVGGAVSSLTAGGDLSLRLKLQVGRDYEFTAGGDLVLWLDEPVTARFEASAGGGVTDRLGGAIESSLPGYWSREFGEGGPTVKLRAGGEIVLKPRGDEKREHGEIHREERHRTREEAREQARRMRDEAQRIRHEALKMKQQLREQLRAQRDEIRRSAKTGFRIGGFSFGFGKGAKKFGEVFAPDAPGGRTSEEERLKILKMLQDQTITAEQAEMLLEALGD